MKNSSKNNITHVQFTTEEEILKKSNQTSSELDDEIQRILLSQVDHVANIVRHEVTGLFQGTVSTNECINTIIHNTSVLIDSIKSIGL